MTYSKGQTGRPKKCKVTSHKAVRQRLIEIKGEPECERCGYNRIPEVVQVHHVIERAHGGSDEPENLQFLCPTCHCEEHHLRKV